MSETGEVLIPEKPQANVFNPTLDNWQHVRERIVQIEQENFGDGAYSEEELSEAFANPNNTTVVLYDVYGNVIGYSYAIPITKYYPKRKKEIRETVFIDSTAIDKKQQGKGNVGILIDKLEDELKAKGFRYIERTAAVPNGYADALKDITEIGYLKNIIK